MEKVIILNGTELGYQVIRALGEKGIRSIVLYDQDKDEIGRYSKYVTESIRIPGFIENPSLLLDFLLEKKGEWAGFLIVPTKDYTVEFLAAHQDILSKYYRIPKLDIEIVQKIMNKSALYRAAESLGIAVPKTFSPKTRDELNHIKADLRFPCLIKPGLGHLFYRKHDIKMIEVDTFEELVDEYKCLTSDFTKDEYELSISEIIPGPDSEQMIQYASYIDRSGELLASMTSRKIRQDPPKYGYGRVVKSEKSKCLDEMSYALLKNLGYHGFSEIEWKYDPREDKYKLIEINMRFIFYIGLCVACGINFPYIQYLDLVKGRKARSNSYQSDIYWIHLYKDVLHTLLHHHLEQFSLKEYMAPYLGRKVFAVLNKRDPKPFYYQWKQHAINMMKQKTRRIV